MALAFKFKMKIYTISQNVNTEYDTYSDAIVVAENEDEARKIHPDGDYDYKEAGTIALKADRENGTWAKKKYVIVEYIGEAKEGMKKGVICASFHAG